MNTTPKAQVAISASGKPISQIFISVFPLTYSSPMTPPHEPDAAGTKKPASDEAGSKSMKKTSSPQGGRTRREEENG
jgi:hypothetical protein